LEDVVEEWRFWREVDEDPATGANPALKNIQSSIPPGWVRREYSQRGWLPLVADKGGNYMGIDMNPDAKGAIGQLIVFGRDFDTKVVLWRGDGEAGWAKWLASFVEELEAGEGFELGGVDGSEGSEDDVGYESYFFDGSAAKGSGGDSGGGGIRLTGEYKGWPVLEALADRSMRRWIEAGIMPPIEIPTAVSHPSNAVQTLSNSIIVYTRSRPQRHPPLRVRRRTRTFLSYTQIPPIQRRRCYPNKYPCPPRIDDKSPRSSTHLTAHHSRHHALTRLLPSPTSLTR